MANDRQFRPSTAVEAPANAQGESLSDKAERCRRLAAAISDRQAADVLRGMALQYEGGAEMLKG